MGIQAAGLSKVAGQLINWPWSETQSARRSPETVAALGQGTNDELTLSAEAEALNGPLGADLLGKLFPGVPCEAGGNIRPDDLREHYADQQQSLNSRIQSLLKSSGIDVPPEIRLQVGGDGSVVVANDHPDRERIEELFRENPRLRNQFVQVASLGELLRAADEAVAFQKAYAADPQAAVTAFSHLFSGQERPQFSLTVYADGATAQFV